MPVKALLLATLVLAGCGQRSQPVDVQILPSGYRVGDVKSPLATPVVDEVVRLAARKVHISACRSTPPAKVIQFNVELAARLNAEVTGGFFESCPES